ncbi:MAG: ribosome recycling factor [Candidatus Marinimicrobia bacterium]|jgi:ribosome recycling factor|nr:ribosome recycling factor [Candidatus Neomarinimicrobiota bacterium]MBT5955740.1 ribosome recycling factor [Candidatus Neomarinimicrobiota bacterium]MBT6871591.1 ribosome recycling factor [Candidatus Neomarinimicrobiota bacterium]MBT7377172.1 ribosome recycling factor [Candidatus Neomarinimicrobiota bacterium]|tara:strand:+ start:12108 stop:12662 length:555 start_codon:yes stop_codon:yes gene_type:complete
MINDIFVDVKERMAKALDHYRQEVSTVRTGRASSNILDLIKVDYYGTMTALNNMANVSVPEAQLIVVQPFDPTSLESIERAILNSDLGLTPNNDGNVIRLNIPSLTEERRKEFVKIVHKMIEDGRVAIRNIRRDVNDHLKKMEKDGDLSEDNLKRALDNVQETTDEFIKELNALQEMKEKELMI